MYTPSYPISVIHFYNTRSTHIRYYSRVTLHTAHMSCLKGIGQTRTQCCSDTISFSWNVQITISFFCSEQLHMYAYSGDTLHIAHMPSVSRVQYHSAEMFSLKGTISFSWNVQTTISFLQWTVTYVCSCNLWVFSCQKRNSHLFSPMVALASYPGSPLCMSDKQGESLVGNTILLREGVERDRKTCNSTGRVMQY